MKTIHNKPLKTFAFVLGIGLVAPYFIPTRFKNKIPNLPFKNSSFFRTFDNITLHTQVFRPNGKELGKVLMIHGLGDSTYSYSFIAPILQEYGYFVVSVDLPAFGYSSKDTGINHSQLENAKRLWGLLEQWDLEMDSKEPWTIVGHSMGGSTSLAMTNQNPSRIASLILLSPAITRKPSKISWIFRSPLGQWLKVLLRYRILTEKYITKILEQSYNAAPSKQDIENVIHPLQITTTPQALLDFVVSTKNVVINELIPQDVEIHLIWGENDTIIPFKHIETIQKHYSIASLTMIKNGGHSAHERDPIVKQKILDILMNQS